MRLGFATDIHLNFLKAGKQRGVGRYLAHDVDALVLGGDLSEADTLFEHMKDFIEGANGKRVFFVLGNHDYWWDKERPDFHTKTLDDVRAIAQSLNAVGGTYLDTAGVVELSPTTALVGRSGFYDARVGPLHRVEMNDWHKVPYLVPGTFHRDLLAELCQKWADADTAKAQVDLEAAAQKYKNVFFVTHVPPWIETCWNDHEGQTKPQPSSPDWLPWSTNIMLGVAISALAEKYPETQFQVLTGHTHCQKEFELTPNLRVCSGGSAYGNPRRAKMWDLRAPRIWEVT